MKTIKATQGKLIVKPLPSENMTESGIVLSKSVNEDFERGKIVSCGAPYKDMIFDGKIDEVVVYHKLQGSKYSFNGEKYKILNQSDILIIEKDE